MASTARGTSAVFAELSVTDSACEYPYIPTCLAARAVKRATGHQPPPASLRKFLDEDVEQTPMRRLTRPLFEQLCRLISNTEQAETAAEARSAARQVFGKKDSMSATELRAELLRTSETESALTEREINHIVEEVSKFTPSAEHDKGVVSVSDMERYLLSAASGAAGAPDAYLQGPASSAATPPKGECEVIDEKKHNADAQKRDGVTAPSDSGSRPLPTSGASDAHAAAAQQRQAVSVQSSKHGANSSAPPPGQQARPVAESGGAPPEPGQAHPRGPRTHPKSHEQKCCAVM